MIVVLTATDADYRAFRALMSSVETHSTAAGTIFEVGDDIALGFTGKGNVGAAALTERAIGEFAPSAVFFVGVADPLVDWLHAGDVVVATKVYSHHGGREDSAGFRARPRAWEAPHRIEQLARHIARSGQWWTSPGSAPHVHFEPIAAGEVESVGDSALSRQLRQFYNDAVALEMESAGVASTGHLATTPTFTVRGIGSAAGAAAFALAVIKQLSSSEPAKPPAGRVIKNVISGGSHQFVVQAGAIHGNVNYGTADPLDAFGKALVAARRSRVLDEALFSQASVALDDLKAAPSDPARVRVLRDLLAWYPDLLKLLP